MGFHYTILNIHKRIPTFLHLILIFVLNIYFDLIAYMIAIYGTDMNFDMCVPEQKRNNTSKFA